MNEKNGEKVICPACGHIFEIKEYAPVWSFTEEGQEVQKALNSVELWTKLNSIVVALLGVLVVSFFILADFQMFGYILYLLSIAVTISGVIYLYELESKLFRKLMKKRYPIAFHS